MSFCYYLLFLLVCVLVRVLVQRKKEEEIKRKKEEEIKSGLKKIEMVCECGKIYPEGTNFCAIDGEPLTRRVVDNFIWQCPTCKKTYAEGGYCPSDGKKLERVPKKS